MRLVAGKRYVRGPSGEVLPYGPGMEKIKGCVVFTQNKDESDGFQLPENENLGRFRGRRSVETASVEPQVEVVNVVQKEVKPVRSKSVVAKKTFESAEFDLREEMASDLSESSGPAELE